MRGQADVSCTDGWQRKQRHPLSFWDLFILGTTDAFLPQINNSHKILTVTELQGCPMPTRPERTQAILEQVCWLQDFGLLTRWSQTIPWMLAEVCSCGHIQHWHLTAEQAHEGHVVSTPLTQVPQRQSGRGIKHPVGFCPKPQSWVGHLSYSKPPFFLERDPTSDLRVVLGKHNPKKWLR